VTSTTEAKALWDAEYERSGKYCVHADDTTTCKFTRTGGKCDTGARRQTMSIVTGSVVAVWTALEELLGRNAGSLTKSEQRMQIVRVELDDGTRLVGLR
jgi:hypothetical protein